LPLEGILNKNNMEQEEALTALQTEFYEAEAERRYENYYENDQT
jgi:hypothetical protein